MHQLLHVLQTQYAVEFCINLSTLLCIPVSILFVVWARIQVRKHSFPRLKRYRVVVNDHLAYDVFVPTNVHPHRIIAMIQKAWLIAQKSPFDTISIARAKEEPVNV